MIIAAIISLGEAGGSHPDDVQDWIEVRVALLTLFTISVKGLLFD